MGKSKKRPNSKLGINYAFLQQPKKVLSINYRNLDTIENLGDTLKSTLTNADDAETLAHDALTSIDARANEIKKNMKSARKLQDDHAELKVWA